MKKTTGNAVVSDILVPNLRDGYMLVKTAAVALNPADWTDIDYDGGYEGCVVGLDYAGTVILPSSTLTEKTFKKGVDLCMVAIPFARKMEHLPTTSSSRLVCKCMCPTI